MCVYRTTGHLGDVVQVLHVGKHGHSPNSSPSSPRSTGGLAVGDRSLSLIMVFIRVRAVHILREAERVLEAVLVEPRNGVLGRFWRALLCSVARTAPGEATRPPTTEFGTISNKSAGGDFTGRARIIENFNVPVLQSLPMEHSLCVVSQDSARCCSFLKIMSP